MRERLTAEAREVHALERSPTASLSTELGDEADSDTDQNGGETLCRLTLLAHEDNEGAIGAILEEVASTDGLEVRFTGPWPPYTFARSWVMANRPALHNHETEKDDEALVDVLDVLLRDGAILRADVIVSVADVPLVGIKLTAAIAGMKTMTEYGLFEVGRRTTPIFDNPPPARAASLE